MNPVAIRLLNQQLIVPQFKTPTEVVSQPNISNRWQSYEKYLSYCSPVIKRTIVFMLK